MSSCNASMIFHRYKEGKQSEADESVSLQFVPVSEFKKSLNLDFSALPLFSTGKMTPHCQAGLKLYHMMLTNTEE